MDDMDFDELFSILIEQVLLGDLVNAVEGACSEDDIGIADDIVLDREHREEDGEGAGESVFPGEVDEQRRDR